MEHEKYKLLIYDDISQPPKMVADSVFGTYIAANYMYDIIDIAKSCIYGVEHLKHMTTIPKIDDIEVKIIQIIDRYYDENMQCYSIVVPYESSLGHLQLIKNVNDLGGVWKRRVVQKDIVLITDDCRHNYGYISEEDYDRVFNMMSSIAAECREIQNAVKSVVQAHI